MFKCRVFDWSNGVLEIIETHWHNLHHALAHAGEQKGTVKVYDRSGEVVHSADNGIDTYA
jgi:hypothetical protein